ncbi:EF-hand domain-containing protein [Parasphingopyxis sp.]|uniref:EF-hand domain-containing protein n=1 Tax=Parasphingopyxis sp. TaxID=1920299 RepID=UPI002609BD1A|nr:EF-hand domain-containing protein [Parasphingopyxis sp.]
MKHILAGIALVTFAEDAPAQTSLEAGFNALDQDSDGNVSIREYLGYRLGQLARADADGDGSLTAEEFRGTQRQGAANNAAAVFRSFDRDEDGLLGRNEFILFNAYVFRTHLDQDENDALTFEEYRQIMQRRR